jgi:hypothetical protein
MVLNFYAYIGNYLMRFNNLSFLFIAAIYSVNLYAALLMRLSRHFSFSWLISFTYQFLNWLLMSGYLVSITSIYLLIVKKLTSIFIR